MKESFRRWLDGETDLLGHVIDAAEGHNLSRLRLRELQREEKRRIREMPRTKKIVRMERKAFLFWYRLVSLLCCGALMAVFLYMTANISRYGEANPRADAVAERYIEEGLEETGAVNIVAGLILDYRAFDTLGESHVLFTALVCVMILLRLNPGSHRISPEDDYPRIGAEEDYPTHQDAILRRAGTVLVPCVLLFGVYILLGGHLGPGGGFSGGTVLGTGLILLSAALGDGTADRFLTRRRFHTVTFAALAFYSFAKGYVFFMGGNGLENHIPLGTPGAILSAGLILPLDIAVGLVVACTMYGFYSLFRRGGIGGD